MVCKDNAKSVKLILYNRLGEDWKQARRAINKQILPSNVQTYTAGLNDIVADFVEHMGSVRDAEGRVKDISIPLRRLLTASEYKGSLLLSF